MSEITLPRAVFTGRYPTARLLGCLLLLLCVAAARAADASQRREILSLLERARSGEIAALEVRIDRIDAPALQALARAQIAASRLDGDAAQRALEDFFASGDRGLKTRAQAWEIATAAAFADGNYARAAAAARERLALPIADGDGIAQLYGIAAALADAPVQRVVERRPAQIPTRRDRAGLLRAAVMINGHKQEAVIDTGANLSVVSASAAKRLGLRLLEGENSVESGTRASLATRLALAEQLRVAGITLTNVAFLVIDDSQLEMPLPGGYRIDAIVGFPVLRAMQRLRFGTDFNTGGSLAAEHPAPANRPAAENLRVIGNALYVSARVQGEPVSLQLDTGAAQSRLSSGFAQYHRKVLSGLERRQQRYASAGGASVSTVALWPQVEVTIGGRGAELSELPICLPDTSGPDSALLGMDLLSQFESYTLDFANLRLELGVPVINPAIK